MFSALQTLGLTKTDAFAKEQTEAVGTLVHVPYLVLRIQSILTRIRIRFHSYTDPRIQNLPSLKFLKNKIWFLIFLRLFLVFRLKINFNFKHNFNFKLFFFSFTFNFRVY